MNYDAKKDIVIEVGIRAIIYSIVTAIVLLGITGIAFAAKLLAKVVSG